MTARQRLLILISLLIVTVGGAAVPRATASATAQSPFTLVLPVFNNAGLQAVQSQLGRYLRSGDMLVVSSGNATGTVNTAWVGQAATTLKSQFPATHLVALTSGLANVQAAAGLHSPIEAIAYDYEPNRANEPEFSWNSPTTMTNVAAAAAMATQHGFRAIVAPTGRPILESDLQVYKWNYGALSETRGLSTSFVQTQANCKSGQTAFQAAISRVVSQYAQLGLPQTWYPQVTVDPTDPNGVTASLAAGCSSAALSSGLPGVVLWWSPGDTADAATFLHLLGR